MNRHSYTICLALAVLLSGTAYSQERPEGRRLALVIGISYYSPLSRLDRPAEDAWNVGEVLRNKANFTVTRIMDASSNLLRQQVSDFAATIQPNDVVVVYYAGHGVQANGRNYILPSDFPDDASKLASMALPVDELLQTIDARDPTIKLLILDSCRNSPLSGISEDGLAQMAPAVLESGTRIEFAASAGQVALDGLFATHLQAELARPGLGVDDVFRNVRARVEQESGGRQTTMSADQLTINFYFIPAQLRGPGEALEILERVASTKPRGELGQTEAVEALVQQGQSLAGTDLLEGLSLKSGTFNEADFSRARLTAAELDGSSIRNGGLIGASLAFATLNGTDLTGSTAHGAAFSFVEAEAANFSGMQATGSTWFAAMAHDARFEGSLLQKAGFAYADLRGASFDGADLTGAVFFATDLRGATFEGAVLDGTDFTGSLLDADALTPRQAAGACRMPLPVEPEGPQFAYLLTVVGIEPIPSARFDGGYEYARFSETQHLFRVEATDFATCGRRELPDDPWYPLWQHRGQDLVRDEIRFRLSHDLLQQTGRRAEVRARIERRLERLYSFPQGAFTAAVAASDLPPEHQELSGSWSLEFQSNGTLLLNRANMAPIPARYERQPRYRFAVSGDSGILECAGVSAEYRWRYTEEGHVRLSSSPEDRCMSRKLLLEAHDWVPEQAP